MRSHLKSLALAAVVPALIAAGCGSNAKTTAKSPSNPPPTTTTQYHSGERCQSNQSVVYAAKGFTCVNGKLQRKPTAAPATKTHKTHTTKTGPQGY